MPMTEILAPTASIVASLSTIAAGVFAVFRWILPAIKQVFKVLEDIKKLEHEFRPNGGSSMRDQIDKLVIQSNQAYDAHVHLRNKFDTLENSVGAIAARQWALVATQPAPVFETNAKGECIRANTSYLNLVERDFEQIKGYGWELCLHPDDKEMVIEEWSEAVGKDRPFELTFRIRAALTGRNYRVQCMAHPYHDHNGDVLGYLGRYVSITGIAA